MDNTLELALKSKESQSPISGQVNWTGSPGLQVPQTTRVTKPFQRAGVMDMGTALADKYPPRSQGPVSGQV